ncbi:uncharacterized protein LOC143323578 isoform X1 [Chaetodon auriga]|uniref:uncharacterized protein LOC143323578 isoform X1 n=1 Tax=Chaetodon auriga TaxID=39042 RepID=UPI0040330DC3
MASPCNPQYFQNQSLSLWLLALVFTLTWCFSVSESHAQIQLTGEVGGNVTIHCPYDKHRTIQFFYFQKGDIFVNGYYDSRNIRETGIWNNTRVDHGKATVHMTNLNISHIGTYKCHIMYKNSASPSDTDIHLSLTAKYSKPEVTTSCFDGFGCHITCSSHGGYPYTKVTWSEPMNELMKDEISSANPDPHTMTFNSSSSAYFNCSNGELNFSCSVGQVTSDMLAICTPKDPPEFNHYNHYAIAIAISAVVVFSIMVASLVWWQYKKGKTGVASVDVRQEWKADGYDEEAAKLSEQNEGEQAS